VVTALALMSAWLTHPAIAALGIPLFRKRERGKNNIFEHQDLTSNKIGEIILKSV
jgi:hypothetical protein